MYFLPRFASPSLAANASILFSAIVTLLEDYAQMGTKESPAPLCARSSLFVPSRLPVLISDVTHPHGGTRVEHEDEVLGCGSDG